MNKCIVCGKENVSLLCDECRAATDIEKLCREMIAYKAESGENPLWESVIASAENRYYLWALAFELSGELATPRKEYMQVMSRVGIFECVNKKDRPWFYGIYDAIKDDPVITEDERIRLHGIAIAAYFMDYEYAKAENVAFLLGDAEDMPWQVCHNLAEFYTTTRRYHAAEEIIANVLRRYADVGYVTWKMQKLADKNAKYLEKAAAGKAEYMPNPNEGRDEVRKKYVDFLESIGIEVTTPTPVPKKRVSAAIPKDQYPTPTETRDTDFDTFVAFDLETTGRNSRIDSIIEIGAIRVVNGEIVEREEFIFSELAKPYNRRLTDEIQALTGISAEDVADARKMWEVFADFMKFVGDDVLLGFNCIAFDSKFLVRAGRYANIVMKNAFFDVMRYAQRFADELGIEGKQVSLAAIASTLGIENPVAHRALADAVTTARVFLKLRSMDDGDEAASVDEMLSDLDEW